jgi:hypothetical protein
MWTSLDVEPQRPKAAFKLFLIAALKRCATQNQFPFLQINDTVVYGVGRW